jgi:hypothetical protein
MAQRLKPSFAHRDRQNPEARAHREILMLVQRLAPARRLVMNAPRRRHIKHLPTPAQPVAKIKILTWRASRKKRCKAGN